MRFSFHQRKKKSQIIHVAARMDLYPLVWNSGAGTNVIGSYLLNAGFSCLDDCLLYAFAVGAKIHSSQAPNGTISVTGSVGLVQSHSG